MCLAQTNRGNFRESKLRTAHTLWEQFRYKEVFVFFFCLIQYYCEIHLLLVLQIYFSFMCNGPVILSLCLKS